MEGPRSKIGEIGRSTANISVQKKSKEPSKEFEPFERGVIRVCQGMEWSERIVVGLGTCFQRRALHLGQ